MKTNPSFLKVAAIALASVFLPLAVQAAPQKGGQKKGGGSSSMTSKKKPQAKSSSMQQAGGRSSSGKNKNAGGRSPGTAPQRHMPAVQPLPLFVPPIHVCPPRPFPRHFVRVVRCR